MFCYGTAALEDLGLQCQQSVNYTFEVKNRRVGRGGAMGANAPPPPTRAEKVRLEGSKDELTKKKNAKDESFLLICQRTQLFTVKKTYPRLLIT